MAKYSEEDRDKLIISLRQSIQVCPIELQLMYLYTLASLLFSKHVDGNYFTSLENIKDVIAVTYFEIVEELRSYRNMLAHEGIVQVKESFTYLKNNKFEVDMLAQMCSVTLNWDNSLNLF